MRADQKLKEMRTNEAMTKSYLGLEGKFATIAKQLGHEILHQGSLTVDTNYMSDPYALETDDLPIMEEDEESYPIGLLFDGLSRGINLSIRVMFDLREITVRYHGRIVYWETEGELRAFAPTDDWEQKIEMLHAFVKKIEKDNRPIVRKEQAILADRTRKKILEELRLKWGL